MHIFGSQRRTRFLIISKGSKQPSILKRYIRLRVNYQNESGHGTVAPLRRLPIQGSSNRRDTT